jgi:hypothetical protein
MYRYQPSAPRMEMRIAAATAEMFGRLAALEMSMTAQKGVKDLSQLLSARIGSCVFTASI